jgi:hypothetical protein
LPAGVVNVITNAPEDAPERDGDPDRASGGATDQFHGFDTKVGRIIARGGGANTSSPRCSNLAARRPLIVLDDADLDAAVESCRLRRLHESGADLHVDGTPGRRRENRRQISSAGWPPRPDTLMAGDPHKGNTPLGSLIGKDAAFPPAGR